MIGPGGIVTHVDVNLDEVVQDVYEVEAHFHNVERWIGASGVVDSLTGYSLVSGNNAFGNAVDILTALQTPIQAGKLFFDLHRIMPLTLSSSTVYMIRIIYGSGTSGDAEIAGQYSDFPILSTGVGALVRGAPADFKFYRLPVGTKIWAKCKNATNNATFTCLFGLHEYIK